MKKIALMTLLCATTLSVLVSGSVVTHISAAPNANLLPLETKKQPATPTRIHIKNDGRIKLVFSLSTNNINWKRFSLSAGKARYYSSGLKKIKFLYVKVKTRKRGFVNYRLRIGRHFMIRWNKKKKIWDVMKIEYVKQLSK